MEMGMGMGMGGGNWQSVRVDGSPALSNPSAPLFGSSGLKKKLPASAADQFDDVNACVPASIGTPTNQSGLTTPGTSGA